MIGRCCDCARNNHTRCDGMAWNRDTARHEICWCDCSQPRPEADDLRVAYSVIVRLAYDGEPVELDLVAARACFDRARTSRCIRELVRQNLVDRHDATSRQPKHLSGCGTSPPTP